MCPSHVFRVLCFGVLMAACVPRERAAKRQVPAATGGATQRASAEQGPPAQAPSAEEPAGAPARAAAQPLPVQPSAAADPALDGPYTDDFERTELGPAWRSTSPVWRLSEGRLCGQNARNHPVWLARRL